MLLLLAIGWVLVLAVDWLVARKGRQWAERLPPAERPVLETRYRLLRRVILAVLGFVAVAVALFAAESTRAVAQTVLASSAVIGIVVGFAARTTLANFVAGISIAINQPVRLGDRVTLNDSEGIVEDIGLTYTRLRTPANRRILIPNEQLVNSVLVNDTLIDPASLAEARIPVPLGADHERVRELLRDEAALLPGRDPGRGEPEVAVAELTETAAIYSVSAWTPDPAAAAAAAGWLRRRLLERLAEEGIALPVAGSEAAR